MMTIQEPEMGFSSTKQSSSYAEIQYSLKQEIMLLENRLQDQVSLRRALENAIDCNPPSPDIAADESKLPKTASQLIQEIAELEFKVGNLERNLLSLYRKALFDQQQRSLSMPRIRPLHITASDIPTNLSDKSNVQRSHSSLSQCPAEPLGKSLRACQSQPLPMMEYAAKCNSQVISLAEHLGACIPETPNKISEDMVKCMCNIYYKISGSSLPEGNPLGLEDFTGPYNRMVQVTSIYRDNRKLGDIECLMQSFRSLVSRLVGINPGKMAHNEKLAFWINIHNALAMHAFLAYGIPQNNTKRTFLFLKAAYNIGCQIVSVDTIQSSILGCRLHRPGQWLRFLVPTIAKFKPDDACQRYAIDRPEPLLYFALSSGCHSDPAVHVYTPKKVFHELEDARQAYIRATCGVRNDYKIVLPKIVDYYAKDSSLSNDDVLEMVRRCLPDLSRKCVKKRRQAKKGKNIEWVSHNFSFRYIIPTRLM